jgi:hypothetical protein
VAVGLLTVELLVAAATRRYPFLDDRTSLFFTTLLTVCGALGVASVIAWSARRPLTLPLGVAVAVAAGALLVPAAHAQALRPMPPSTLRQQVAYVLSHHRPGDTIVVGSAASFPFAYYWPDRPTFTPTTAKTAVLFQVDYPGRPDLVLARGRQAALIEGAVREAAARSGSRRVWLVLAEAGDHNPAWRPAVASVGHLTRRQLPRLLVVDRGDGGRRS